MLKVLITCVWLLGSTWAAMAQASSVVFLNPGMSTEAFWVNYAQFMQAAATDLGLDLRVRYSERIADTTLAQAREALQGNVRPDYLVLVNEQYIAPQILRMAEGSGVKLLIVNNALTADQAQMMGSHQHPDWIASLVADDEQAGYLMLIDLLRQYGPVPPGASIDLLAFSGTKTTPAAQLRERGLHRALAEHPEVRLRQLVYGEWSRQRAFEQATQLFKRNPQTVLVWAANDEMALGAMQAVQTGGRAPGKDVLFSAVNSSPEILQARLDGRLTTLVAGHFTLGGWAMVLINDHAKGVDLDAHGGRDRQAALFQLIDASQARHLLGPPMAVDFHALSAVGKPASYRYPFSLQLLLR
ncbi:ABC transporter substrate-binding protein [Pseudomonas trivialis]|uniref:ABC-type sugar transport system, substrate-binding protein, contains N-terminal xre family HTH domain n=1 Tax=Pseudomonas trivialis TaxID=200450 RepID=A0A0R2ZBQ6_9PSED|nr:ABC transporter substrate-binding protein [Pseudomonas trivialis]KRP58576.1 LacI family transcriptional regulator [Pseudomonas trivialis]SDS76808.1 ABC-type sugar transport system, substrate-binding protein, contains N-terminal xre family HTH domain [Pseudomonas trivialis]